jgi:hypothetical protein
MAKAKAKTNLQYYRTLLLCPKRLKTGTLSIGYELTRLQRQHIFWTHNTFPPYITTMSLWGIIEVQKYVLHISTDFGSPLYARYYHRSVMYK